MPRGALHAAAQGSRARTSTARELGILAGEGALPTKTLAQGVEAGQIRRTYTSIDFPCLFTHEKSGTGRRSGTDLQDFW